MYEVSKNYKSLFTVCKGQVLRFFSFYYIYSGYQKSGYTKYEYRYRKSIQSEEKKKN